MKEITVQELKNKIDNGERYQLIDVREPHEFDFCNIDGELIPMGSIIDQAESISRDMPVIIHCKSGSRSAAVIKELESRYQFTNLYNLKGGIMAYAREIDPKLPLY